MCHEIEQAVMTIISAKWEGGYVHGEANQPMNSNVDACNCDI